MQLAAVEMYHTSGQKEYLSQAVDYGRLEPVTPWMGADSARHYQWYPFVNLENDHLAVQNVDIRVQKEFIRNMKSGLQRVEKQRIPIGEDRQTVKRINSRVSQREYPVYLSKSKDIS